jgi:phosphatidylglycerol lysyltransferase
MASALSPAAPSPRFARGLRAAAALLLLALGLAAVRALSRETSWREIGLAAGSLPLAHGAAAAGFTILSYAALGLQDPVILSGLRRKVRWPVALLAGFGSYALGHTLGLTLLTGGSVRQHVYGREGVTAVEIGSVLLTAAAAFWAAVLMIIGSAAMLGAAPLPGVARAAAWPMAALVAIAAALAAAATRRSLGGWLARHGFRLPAPLHAVAVFGLSLVDLTAAAAALFVLLPAAAPSAFPTFLAVFALACAVAALSHVPGGAGIFEAVMLAGLPGDRPALLAALILFRLVYYLLPLCLAAALLILADGRRLRGGAGLALSGARTVATAISPALLSLLVFIGGAVLLVSGSLPALPGRLHALRSFVPLPFVEASHLAASLAGTGLLLLAPGLYRRLDGAFFLTRALLVAGALFSIGKGIDYEEAALLLALAALLQSTRPAFYRRTALLAEPISPRWILSILLALGASLWIGLIAYRNVAYSADLWWHFAWKGEASRFLRGGLGAAILCGAWALSRMLGPGATSLDEGLPPAVAERALAQARSTDALLAFTGDKRFILSSAGDAFLMYAVRRRSWIVMGDPVGPRRAWPELLWAIRARADAAQGRLLLYQISPDLLPLAVELGLSILKYGEEAKVDLAAFSLEASGMRGLRQSARRARREGARFEVGPAAGVPAILPALREISEEWLRARGRREKGFSLGRFLPDYLARFDCALVLWEGRIVAFANIWDLPGAAELSVDLMRHRAVLPYGTMDFLFAELMRWGRARGYRSFSLGLAPLSGIEARRLSPGWAKLAALLFRHGWRRYGFAGLRAYKEKFGPSWTPRFVAGPGGLEMVRALIDLRALIDARRPPAEPPAAHRLPALLRPLPVAD